MPKSVASELLNHYQQLQTTLARCLRIERKDGKIIALTEHDVDLLIDGMCYQSAIEERALWRVNFRNVPGLAVGCHRGYQRPNLCGQQVFQDLLPVRPIF